MTELPGGEKERQSVTKDGTSVLSRIHDVRTRTPVNHVDYRGSLFEMFNDDLEFWDTPVVYAYQFSIRRGQVKGWARHEHKDDRYTLITGEALVLLYDGRAGSPTAGVTQHVVLSGRATRQLFIPRGVWHLSVNIDEGETCLVNFPTAVYHHEDPDRFLLPWNSPEIPVDVASFLPKA